MKTIRIGCGAGYSGDRIEPAVELAEEGALDYLVFECLAERTIAIAQQARLRDAAAGYDPLLEARMRAVLPPCARNGVRIVTNMGAANPRAAARRVRAIADELGLPGLKIAAIDGDDVLETLLGGDYRIEDHGTPVASLGERIVSAKAYLGAQPLAQALAAGADVVITGRVADPALVLAPLLHAYGWRMDDWDRLGQGTLVGHLLECAGQVTGGYFADPGRKDVPGLARLGFPIAEVAEDGTAVITKLAGTGGMVTRATCTEQLLYEIHDPAAYVTPDVVADFSGVRIEEEGPDRVRVSGARGRPRPETLKVSIGYIDSHIGEGQISYAGPNAVARGQLAIAIVEERLRLTGARYSELRCDLIGMHAISGAMPRSAAVEPGEVRVRIAARTGTMADAAVIGNEVEALYTCGPAGGGGAVKSARQVVAVLSALLPRALVQPAIHVEESASQPGKAEGGSTARVARAAISPEASPVRAPGAMPSAGIQAGAMQLHEIAHARAGDKGDVSNLSLIAYDHSRYALLERHVTAERVRAHFAGIVRGEVVRYALPQLGALNFVMREALGGGVTRSLALDAHGKCLSSLLLEMEIPDSAA